MNPMSYTWIIAVGLFLGILAALETGRRIGVRQLAHDPEGARQGVGVVEGAVFGLMGLLIAFTFSGATP
jgi:phosphotransferase system  glucose/maltose/N-acetylglucosamine-specific IIC component